MRKGAFPKGRAVSRPARRGAPRPVADPTPPSLRRSAPARRALVPPKSPYPLPISTLDWLLSRESPAARYVVLRDLLGRPAKDIELRKARQAVIRDLYVRDVLTPLRKRLAPGFPADELEKRYEGVLWQTLLLLEMGCDASVPELKRAADLLFVRWEKAFVDLARGDSREGDRPLLSISLRTFALLGFGDDARVLAGVEQVARGRLAGGDDARAERPSALAKDLLLFASLPAAARSPLVLRAIDFSVERAVGVAIPAEVASGRVRFGFPTMDETDLLELLDALAALRVPRRPELGPALALLASKADHRARWKLERPLAAPTLLELERVGELSRWVTIRALRVLQHFLELTLLGAK